MSSGSGSSSPSSQTITQKDEIPKYKQDYQLENYDIARDIAKTPYQTYGGQRTADWSDLQKSGFDTVKTTEGGAPLYNKYGPATDAAKAATTAKYGDTLTPSDTKDWLSPYIEDALKPTLDSIDRDAIKTEHKIDATATGAGAFGDARTGVELGENDRNTNQLKADEIAKGYDKGYNNAVLAAGNAFTANAGQYNSDTANNLKGATTLDSSLTSQGDYASKAGTDLLSAGKTERSKDQEQLDLAYEDFINQQQYPTEQLNTRLSADKGQPYSTTRLTTTPYSSTAQGIGALSSLYGLAGKATAA